MIKLPLVAAQHQLWAQRDRLRGLLWSDRLGYEPRLPPPNRIELVDTQRAEQPPRATPRNDRLGVLSPDLALAEGGRLLGLGVAEPGARGMAGVVERALSEGWPLLGASPEALPRLSESCWDALVAFVLRGGTFFLPGAAPSSNAVLDDLCRRLGVAPLQARANDEESAGILFPGRAASFAHELAGVQVESRLQGFEVAGGDEPASVLAFGVSTKTRRPTIVERSAGAGRIVVGGFPARLEAPLRDCLEPGRAPALLPPMMLIRQLYGSSAWHPPALLANFTVDDPALREGLLGFRYSRTVALAREHGFHLTVATIPAELGLAEPAVVESLKRHPEFISACYHGSKHDGYEFYLTQGRRMRSRSRPLPGQVEALRRAVRQGRDFAARSGYELERVMVFPHGLGPAAVLPELHRLGFLATCNLDDRYPLESPPPPDEYLGLRPGDTAWDGSPLLWRRSLADDRYVLDLFFGRPALTFEHRRPLGEDLEPFRRRAEQIRSLTRGRAAWRGLDEVARHAYLQRLDPERGWQVLMGSNEACLHNPDSRQRTYQAVRPHLPAGSLYRVEGRPVDAELVEVIVPPGGTAVVRVVPEGPALPLPDRSGCSIVNAPGRLEA